MIIIMNAENNETRRSICFCKMSLTIQKRKNLWNNLGI